MEKTLQGYKKQGSWDEVVEFGRKISKALDKDLLEEKGLAHEKKEWEKWRPKQNEDLDKDMNQKTAEQARLSENEREKQGKTPQDDLKKATEEIEESAKNIVHPKKDTNKGVSEGQNSINHASKAAGTLSRRLIRKIETITYKKIMTQVSPYYFDNALISANIGQGNFNGSDFTFEVTINDEEIRENVDENFKSLD